MDNTTLTIKTPKKLRSEAKRVADELGVPLTTAMNAMLRQFVRDRRLVLEEACPFPSHIPNRETRMALREARARKGSTSFKTLAAFKRHASSL
jgi:addiction module RelB/DinJ family antitoxin